MNSKPLTVVAEMEAKPGSEATVRAALTSLIAPSRGHAGCITYDLHEANDHTNHFMFYENWTSKDLLDQHLADPFVAGVLSQIAPLLTNPARISLWTKTGSTV